MQARTLGKRVSRCHKHSGQGTTKQTVELYSITGTTPLILFGAGQEEEHSCKHGDNVSEFGQLPRKGVGQLGDSTGRASERSYLCWREALRLSGDKPSCAPTDVLSGFLWVKSGKRRKEFQFAEHLLCVRLCKLLPIFDVISFFQKHFSKNI